MTFMLQHMLRRLAAWPPSFLSGGALRLMPCIPRRKLRYYARYISPDGLPQLRLYGVYAATLRDGDQAFYTALLRHCECGPGTALPRQGEEQEGGSSDDALRNRVEQAVGEATARLQRFGDEERHALVHGADTHAAVEQLMGMRIFLGGVSHKQYHDWAQRTGYVAGSGADL